MDSLCLRTGLPGVANLESRPSPSKFPAGRPAPAEKGGGVMKTAPLRYSFNRQFRSLVPGAKQGTGVKGAALDDAVSEQSEGQNGKWVMKILQVKSLWSEKGEDEGVVGHEDESHGLCDCEYGDDDDDDDDEETEAMVFDRSSFSKLLKRVSLGDARLYGQMSYLGNLAYAIPTIKPGNRLRRYGLRYVTSSIEKRQELVNADSQQPSDQLQQKETGPLEAVESKDVRNEGPRIDPSAAFQIAASAASYLNSRTRRIFGSRNAHIDREHIDEVASFMATTDSVTAVVAAKEEVKQAVADDLNSVRSAPCEWYICDDDKTATRFFVIQGSETLASWQANLLFEPIKFEGFDIFVHRGIYEAAKGIYQQMLPEILAHTKAHGRRARLRFTGHSLGGSLSLLINLMLLIRGEVPLSSLLPVITFGSPTIMCGGDGLLRKLGLPRSHIQAVTMHRDIVPRAFSCNYPKHVAELLKAVNGNFRHHPCLNNQKILYAPMGELLILQPDAKYSPQHDLLPWGSGLFHLDSSYSDADEAEQLLRAAKLEFLNSPHPLEILSDRSAYGTGGSIHRDHDMNSYLKCVRSVIRHELSLLRKAKREWRRKSWWARGGVLGGLPGLLGPPGQVDISGILRSGSESLRRVSRIVASNNLHLLVLLLFPARWWLVGAFSVIAGFRLR